MSAYATVVTVMVLQITGSIKKLCSLFWEWVLCLDLRSGSKKEKKNSREAHKTEGGSLRRMFLSEAMCFTKGHV